MTQPLALLPTPLSKARMLSRHPGPTGLRRRLASPRAGTPRGAAVPASRLVEMLLPSAADEALTLQVLAQWA